MSESASGKQYKKITRQQRIELLSLIVEKKNTIKRAAKLIGIGASTARMILKKYQNTGDVFQSKADRKTRHIIEKIQKEKAVPHPDIDFQTQIKQNTSMVTLAPIIYFYCPSQPLIWTPIF